MVIISRGDVFLADLGEGIGSEQKGVRPVIVVQNDIGNKYSPTVTVVPVTTKIHKHKGLPTHVLLTDQGGLNELSAAMAEQIVTIDKSRLIEHLGSLDVRFMRVNIERIILKQLGINIRKGHCKGKNVKN